MKNLGFNYEHDYKNSEKSRNNKVEAVWHPSSLSHWHFSKGPPSKMRRPLCFYLECQTASTFLTRICKHHCVKNKKLNSPVLFFELTVKSQVITRLV